MKNLLIIILMLWIDTLSAQTVGQIRYDTTKILKVGGYNELKVQNNTKDSTGGIFTNVGNGWGKWLRSYAVPGGIRIGIDTILLSGSALDLYDVTHNGDSTNTDMWIYRNGTFDTLVFLTHQGAGDSDQEGWVYVYNTESGEKVGLNHNGLTKMNADGSGFTQSLVMNSPSELSGGNKTIYLPNFTHANPFANFTTLVASVNGVFPSPISGDGNVVLPGVSQNLQQVTDIGSTTTNSITANQFIAHPQGSTDAQLRLYDLTNTYFNVLGVQNPVTHDNNLSLPDTTGTLAVSVNGNFADSKGNITISAGAPTLQQVIDAGGQWVGSGAGAGGEININDGLDINFKSGKQSHLYLASDVELQSDSGDININTTLSGKNINITTNEGYLLLGDNGPVTQLKIDPANDVVSIGKISSRLATFSGNAAAAGNTMKVILGDVDDAHGSTKLIVDDLNTIITTNVKDNYTTDVSGTFDGLSKINRDYADGRYATGPTIYTGDGRTGGNRTVSLSASDFTLDSVGVFKIKNQLGNEQFKVEQNGYFTIKGDKDGDGAIVGNTLEIDQGGLATFKSFDNTTNYLTRLVIGNGFTISDITVDNANLIPDDDSAYDLGTSSKRWKNIYVTGGSLHVGAVTFKETGVGLNAIPMADGDNIVTFHSINEVLNTLPVYADLATGLAAVSSGDSFKAHITIGIVDVIQIFTKP